jgi:hypothetical protein
MEQLPLLITSYPPIAYVKGSLLAQLTNHLKDVEPDHEDPDWPIGPIYEATKEFLIENTELWPEIESDENGHEYQDQENFEIISIDEIGAIVASGGDWQYPMRIYITCDLTGQRTVWKAEFAEFPKNGLGDKDILKIIGRG